MEESFIEFIYIIITILFHRLISFDTREKMMTPVYYIIYSEN